LVLAPFFVQQAVSVVVKESWEPNEMKCSYPHHAIPLLKSEHPCAFECEAPFVFCNDICQPLSSSCSPGQPPPALIHHQQQPQSHQTHKRDLEKRKPTRLCYPGFTACKLDPWLARISSHKWDCINTQSDLESCGGCASPINKQTPSGIDCTAIPGVADVYCRAGSCVVQRCLPGYLLSSNRTTCLFNRALFRDSGRGRLKLAHDHGL